MSGIKNLFKKIKAKNNNHWLTSSLADSTGRVTKSIDDHLQKKADNQSQTLNILLLGAGGSGKSTIMKQMARMYNEGKNEHMYCYIFDFCFDPSPFFNPRIEQHF